MERLNDKKLIPDNHKGKGTDVVSEISFSTREEAAKHFRVARERFFHVPGWHSLAGAASATFKLLDEQGNEVSRPVQYGDYFKIDIPGPGLETGDGHDWVQVEAIEQQEDELGDLEYALIKVRPASNPTSAETDTAHFFKGDARSYFLLKRTDNSVSAEVHGRDEMPNTDAEHLVDKLRNAVVAIGAMLGFSNLQWKSLTAGIIDK